MRFTRRLLEQRLSGALVIASLSAVAGLAASCGSDRDPEGGSDVGDGGAADVRDGSVPDDGGGPDTYAPPRDAETSDAAPRPVACTSAPCATSLVTTLGIGTMGGFCALLQDGTVACWGQNNQGQLGRGAEAGTVDSANPARVVGLTDIVAIEHSCAIDKSGATWCWGMGPYFRSDVKPMTNELAPVRLPIPPATRVSTRAAFDLAVACAVTDGGVVCWGMNNNGQVSVPQMVADPDAAPREVPMPAGPPIRGVFVGNASFVLREDGTALSWGANPPLARVSSLFPDPYPKPIALRGVSSIDVINDNACAVAEGIAYCWGSVDRNSNRPLERAIPQLVATPEPVVQIATTSGGGNNTVPQRACACGVSGDVYCWGNNASGQAGDGTKQYATKPVKVVGLPGPAAQVKTVSRTTCALLTSGKIYCWGDNYNGQLGNGQIKLPSDVPTEVVLP